ncbi:MAG: amidohydrolase family protein [Actinobacteria bacterium]|nr:amidohydrolase family protein [Actinomycetota bacterium]MBI3256279.1 amidohydrolase family protein [Actinomycetota bacterium]
MSTEFDLVVRGGTVIDGTGAPRRTADVAIADGRVVEVGKVSGKGKREVDASGALVAPGFVDIHAHYDGQATWDNYLAPSSWQGVTSTVMGNCGVGFAPVRPSDHDRLIELMEGVEDIPGAALHEGLSWEWQSFGEYLDAVDSIPHDIDVGAQVPHGAVRLNVMGERGGNRELATPDDIEKMAALARAGVEAGALGFSTSRTINHRTSRGEPTPTLKASADELVGIARGLGAAGKGVLQVVSDHMNSDEEFDMFRRMVSESGRPLSFSLVQSPVAPDAHREVLDRIAKANADGLAITGQVATRAVGLLFGLQCTLHPFMANPVFQEIAALGVGEQARIMADPGFKERVLAASTNEIVRDKLGGVLIRMFGFMFELGDPPNYEPDLADSIAGRAERAGRTPEEMVYDLLIADEGKTLLYLPTLNFSGGSLDAVGEMLAHPNTVPGLGDGGAHVGTICDGSFPTTLLTMWGRDRDHGQLDLEFLVQRQCRDTARTVGLHDRGVLAPGYKGDLNIIDFEHLGVRRPEVRYDLPAGGRRLVQRAVGYRHTFVNGIETYTDGEATGELPGRLIRGGQSAPV